MSERCLVELAKHNNRARAFLRAATRSNRHTAGTPTSRADNFEPTSTTRRLQRAELAWRHHNKQHTTPFADWLEEHDPYLAWLRTTAPHLHTRRSSRGPRPSQVINTTLERSPVNTQKHKAFPSQLPCPRDNFDKDTDIICDGGAAIFCSPKPEHFIESTLKPTLQQLIGVDDIPHPAAMEGFAQICWADPKQKIIHRITTPGLLTKADHDGYALLSLPSLRDSDAVGSHTPSNLQVDEHPYLYTGNINSPSRIAYLRPIESGLLAITPLSPPRVKKALQLGYVLQDLTSSTLTNQTCEPPRAPRLLAKVEAAAGYARLLGGQRAGLGRLSRR